MLTTLELVALAASFLVGGKLFGMRERLMGSEAREAKASAASPVLTRARDTATETGTAAVMAVADS